jgi:hypothetical protein
VPNHGQSNKEADQRSAQLAHCQEAGETVAYLTDHRLGMQQRSSLRGRDIPEVDVNKHPEGSILQVIHSTQWSQAVVQKQGPRFLRR